MNRGRDHKLPGQQAGRCQPASASGMTFLPMTVQLVRAHRLYGGVPYAYAAVAEPGALVFTAGACPLDQNENVVGAGDVARQAQ